MHGYCVWARVCDTPHQYTRLSVIFLGYVKLLACARVCVRLPCSMSQFYQHNKFCILQTITVRRRYIYIWNKKKKKIWHANHSNQVQRKFMRMHSKNEIVIIRLYAHRWWMIWQFSYIIHVTQCIPLVLHFALTSIDRQFEAASYTVSSMLSIHEWGLLSLDRRECNVCWHLVNVNSHKVGRYPVPLICDCYLRNWTWKRNDGYSRKWYTHIDW